MRDLSDREVGELQELLDADATAPTGSTGAAGEAWDVSALDGLLCGVLLQPQRLAEAAWLPLLLQGRAERSPPPWLPLVRRRLEALNEAIDERRWFDPWIFPSHDDGRAGTPDDAGALRQAVLPWVAGFAMACERFPGLMQLPAPALAEPLALLYLHFDAQDLEGLEDDPALAAALAATDPPADLAQAAEDLVRSVLLLADVSRPVGHVGPRVSRPAARPDRRLPPGPRTVPARAPQGPPPRSKSARRARTRPG